MSLKLNPHWMRRFFYADILLNENEHEQALGVLDDLAEEFPKVCMSV